MACALQVPAALQLPAVAGFMVSELKFAPSVLSVIFRPSCSAAAPSAPALSKVDAAKAAEDRKGKLAAIGLG